MFRRSDVALLKPGVSRIDFLQRGYPISEEIFKKFKSAPGLRISETPHSREMEIVVPGEEVAVRVPTDIFMTDDRRHFQAGDFVYFDPSYKRDTIARDCSLPLGTIQKMQNSPIHLRVGDKGFPLGTSSLVQIFFESSHGKVDWFWIWKGFLLRLSSIDFTDNSNDCKESDIDISELL